MNYTKPEVAVLGEAVCVIESRTQKILGTPTDGVPSKKFNPAYDLDE
jgi:hypothetical protein